MKKATAHPRNPELTRAHLIAAATQLMIAQGWSTTTVDQICAKAGLTKGSFFHHFPSKEAITRAAIDAWGDMGCRLYAQAWSNPDADPLDHLDRLFDIMISFTTENDQPCLCLIGMMAQELSLTHAEVRSACATHLATWTEMVVRLLGAAKQRHQPTAEWDADRVGWLLNSIWQGSMLIAKTRQTPDMLVSNIELARGYVKSLFVLPTSPPQRKEPR